MKDNRNCFSYNKVFIGHQQWGVLNSSVQEAFSLSSSFSPQNPSRRRRWDKACMSPFFFGDCWLWYISVNSTSISGFCLWRLAIFSSELFGFCFRAALSSMATAAFHRIFPVIVDSVWYLLNRLSSHISDWSYSFLRPIHLRAHTYL